MIENEDIERIKGILDGRYVKKTDCDRIVEKTDYRIDKIAVSMAKIEARLGLIAGLLGAIGVAILTAVVKIVFGG